MPLNKEVQFGNSFSPPQIQNTFLMIGVIARALELSMDYLVGNYYLLLEKNVVNKILDIQKFNPKDKGHVFAKLDASLQSQKAKNFRFINRQIRNNSHSFIGKWALNLVITKQQEGKRTTQRLIPLLVLVYFMAYWPHNIC